MTATDSFAADPKSVYDLTVTDINGKPMPLSAFRGKTTVIVNTASKCGFTPQYKQLEALYEKYKDKGVVVVGFPSNDFGEQEPGSNEEIKKFCKTNYGVTFPLAGKSPVTGATKNEVFKYLTEKSGDEFKGEVKWNFEKFLVDKDGRLRARFGSFTSPASGSLTRKLEEVVGDSAKR